MRVDRRLILPLFAVAGLGVYFFLMPRLPKEQTVEIVLGDSAAKVDTVRISYEATTSEWSSEVELHYKGGAPRVVHHEAKMPDGSYKLSIDVSGPGAGAHLERRAELSGGTTSIDVSESVAMGGAP